MQQSPNMSAATLQNLEISAIVLASLCGLFGMSNSFVLVQHVLNYALLKGVYFVLFVLALWSTYRKTTVASTRLRWVTIIL